MIINLDNFFEFGEKKPINRLAFTDEDIAYKVRVIKAMQELGMKIKIDQIGNISGELEVGDSPEKTIVFGSHTDSVYDGGQYDGPVGVISGLMVVERLKAEKDFNGKLIVAIYTCEESSRFGNACIGSKFLKGDLTVDEFEKIIDQKAKKEGKTITLGKAVDYLRSEIKKQVPEIEEVDKIFEKVDYSIETHIEQYKLLHKLSRKSEQPNLGLITSIGSAVRIKYTVEGKADHTGSTPMKKRKNPLAVVAKMQKQIKKLGKEYETNGFGRASQVEISTPGHNGSFNQIPTTAEGMVDIRILGENSPEKAIEDFQTLLKKCNKKGLKCTVDIVSKGTPVVTSEFLNNTLMKASKNPDNLFKMPSYAGQDSGYIPAKEKTMIFIPSKGGSHNPKESTKKRYIEEAVCLMYDGVRELFKENELMKRIKHIETSTPNQEIHSVAQANRTQVLGEGEYTK